MRTYTADDNRFIFNKIEDINAEIEHGISKVSKIDQIESIALGGRYGHGGGCIQSTSLVPVLNDRLEYFVFWKAGYHPTLKEKEEINDLAKFVAEKHNVELEINLAANDWLEHEPVSLRSYNLVAKHHIIFGNEHFLDGFDDHLDTSKIEISEAEKDLHNQLSNILFSLKRIKKGILTKSDSEYINRNITRLKLSLGDACLTVFGKFHWSPKVRNEALHDFFQNWQLFPEETQSQIVQFHDEGLKYTLDPEYEFRSLNSLSEEIDDILLAAQPVWLWAQKEAEDQKQLQQKLYHKEMPSLNLKERLQNLKYFGFSDYLNPHNNRTARERLQECLWELIVTQKYEWMNFKSKRIEKLLNMIPGKDGKQNLVSRYELLWSRLG